MGAARGQPTANAACVRCAALRCAHGKTGDSDVCLCCAGCLLCWHTAAVRPGPLAPITDTVRHLATPASPHRPRCQLLQAYSCRAWNIMQTSGSAAAWHHCVCTGARTGGAATRCPCATGGALHGCLSRCCDPASGRQARPAPTDAMALAVRRLHACLPACHAIAPAVGNSAAHTCFVCTSLL